MIRLIADDLTGALDAAVQFAGRVPGIPVWLSDNAARGGKAMQASGAVCTYSRDLDDASAGGRIAEVAPFLDGAGVAFLKIDSLLRGNWPTDLSRLLAACPDRTCILAPAFPAQRRTMRAGRQIVPLPDGTTGALPIVPSEVLRAAGLRSRAVPVGGRPIADPGGVAICDAVEQSDLDTLALNAAALPGPVLWCGSAGLARALAGDAPPAVRPDPVPPLIVVGSRHHVTLEQLAAAPGSAAARVLVSEDGAKSAEAINRALSGGACIVQADLAGGLSSAEAMRDIGIRLAAALPHVVPPRWLVVIGGETLDAVCRAVGAEALRLEGELTPGVPCARLAGGIWSGVHLTSRSGAFGGPGFLADLLAGGALAAPSGAGN